MPLFYPVGAECECVDFNLGGRLEECAVYVGLTGTVYQAAAAVIAFSLIAWTTEPIKLLQTIRRKRIIACMSATASSPDTIIRQVPLYRRCKDSAYIYL